MWRYFPKHFGAQFVQQGHENTPSDGDIMAYLEKECMKTYKGDVRRLLKVLETKESKARLQASTQMRYNIQPSARYEVPPLPIYKAHC